MQFNAPFKLGPFTVDATGQIAPTEPLPAPAFVFRQSGRLVHAVLDRADSGGGRLALQLILARVHSTAGSPDETVRPRSFALIHWLMKALPAGWRLGLLADHRVSLEADRCIGLPITAAALLTEITCFVLELAPYLELLDSSGLTAPERVDA